MKKDIQTRADIEQLVKAFYEKVATDKELGLIFLELAQENWETHLPAMYNFWENIILFTGTYEGNPMNLHQHLHHIRPLNGSHFDQWNILFTGTVDELFAGPNATNAKEHTLSISNIIRQKILESRQKR